jgi:hypothetical protein
VFKDLFYDILVIDDCDEAHRSVASFDRLRTGLGQVRGSTSMTWQRFSYRSFSVFLQGPIKEEKFAVC